jgi:hypothetical protein
MEEQHAIQVAPTASSVPSSYRKHHHSQLQFCRFSLLGLNHIAIFYLKKRETRKWTCVKKLL